MPAADQKKIHLSHRMQALRELLNEKKLDAYLFTNLSDQFYFTDYKTEGYYTIIGREESWLLLPELLYQQGKALTHGFTCLKGRFGDNLKTIYKNKWVKKIGFDPTHVPYQLGQMLVKQGFVPVAGLAVQLRKIKDPLERERLRKANHLAYRGAEFVRKRLKPGLTEKRMAADLAHFFEIEGHGIAFDLIIAAGANGSFPHHLTSETKMKLGDSVVCDIGATWMGYRSDLTRTFTIGKIPPAFSKVYSIVEKAQKEGIRHVRPGVTAGSVDEVCRRIIRKAGYGKQFIHSTGHGVGIDIHEDPRLSPGMKDILEAGMVITVEPGIYLPGRFGVRIEDTLLVTPDGSEILTQ